MTDNTEREAVLEKALALAKEGLAHYADRDVWRPHSDGDHIRDWYAGTDVPVEANGYDKARGVLAALESQAESNAGAERQG